jgi:hypothetical protein
VAAEVARKMTMAWSDESILVDKFSYDFIPEGCAFPETRLAACGRETSASLFILGFLSNGT